MRHSNNKKATHNATAAVAGVKMLQSVPKQQATKTENCDFLMCVHIQSKWSALFKNKTDVGTLGKKC